MQRKFWLPGILAVTAGTVWAVFAGLSLKIGNEIQPPGGMLQMKVFLTEPKPISTGKGRMAISASTAADVEDVSLYSTAGDAIGAAVVQGTRVQMVCLVPSTVLGSNPDVPLLTITSRIRKNAAIGSSIPLAINPANLVFLNQNGVPYPEEIKSGTLTIANNVSITGVNPGAATVPAGGTVVINGLNFTPTTTVSIKDANVAAVTYVSPTEMDVTLGAALAMLGSEITVTNPDGTSAIFYAFQRTTRVGQSASALFTATLPMFATASWTSATYSLPADGGTTYSGLAFQNLGATTAGVKVSLIAANRTVLGSSNLQLPVNSRIVRKVAELVSIAPPAGSYWLVQSNAPVQILGLTGDDSTGSVSPIVPLSAR
ncbi:MAG: IPT/TIG domain-containing protein [Bryobacteraceae bacterium]